MQEEKEFKVSLMYMRPLAETNKNSFKPVLLNVKSAI